MKKNLLTLLAVVVVFTASAQINKGTVLVGASSNLNLTSTDPDGGESSSVFALDVSAGYFVIDNLALGLNLGYEKNSELDDAAIIIGAFGRYYINGKVFAGAGVSTVKFGDASSTVIPLEIGYAAFITDNIAIEPSLNYSLWSGDFMEGSTIGLNVGLALYFNRN